LNPSLKTKKPQKKSLELIFPFNNDVKTKSELEQECDREGMNDF